MIVSGCTKLSYNTPRMMYTATNAARISHGWLDSELWKAWAAPWKLPLIESGMPSSRWVRSRRLTASPRATPGARLNDRLAAGNRPSWLIDKGPVLGGATWATADSGTISPLSGERR
ncbi:hypothetical protein D3C71_1817160 [compost metagenome]